MEPKDFGLGKTFQLKSGIEIFMLDSFRDNPIVTPEQFNLTCKKDGKMAEGAIFNPGAEVFDGRVVLTPRCHTNYSFRSFLYKHIRVKRLRFKNYQSQIWPLVSEDGIHFKRLGNSKVDGLDEEQEDFQYGVEDLRILRDGDQFILVGTGKINPPFKGNGNDDRTIVYTTKDFEKFKYRGMVADIQLRNTVPFVGEDDRVFVISRFPPDQHMYIFEFPEGRNQLLNPRNYQREWLDNFQNREDHILLKAGVFSHECEKVGAGPPPLRTEKGWLLIYRGVGSVAKEITDCYGLEKGIDRSYNISAALLDLKEPRRVLYRTKLPIYVPSKPFELYGDDSYSLDVPAIVFPMGLVDRDGMLLIYCGSGDKYITLLTCHLEGLTDYLMRQAN